MATLKLFCSRKAENVQPNGQVTTELAFSPSLVPIGSSEDPTARTAADAALLSASVSFVLTDERGTEFQAGKDYVFTVQEAGVMVAEIPVSVTEDLAAPAQRTSK